MTVTLSIWLLPIVLTVALWIVLIVWPIQQSSGDYGFGAAIEVLLRLAAGVVGTLALWLVFFIGMWAFG